jgi:TatD DNase family protein
MIDSHCHLADQKFAKDLPEVIARAVSAGVDRMVCIADSLSESKRCMEIAQAYPAIYCTVGVHPHCASEWREESGERLEALAQSTPRVRAIGEIGLDYHYLNSPKEVQQRVLLAQITIARECGLPVVLHNRDSIDDLRRITTEYPPLKAVIHCCTEPWEIVKDFVDRGFLLSFTGIATYPKSIAIRETIRHCPLERIMIETDSPYLAPVPHRGKRNEPAFVVQVAKCIAAEKGISLAEVDAVTTANAVEFFGVQRDW